MTTVIVCEKNSQAKAIADALAFNGMRGSYKGTSYILTWAAGHLLEFEDPESAKPGATWNHPDSLLPLPLAPKIVPSKGASKGITRVRDALKQADAVILSTDPDREGEAIGRNLITYCGYKGPMQRLWLAGGMDATSIKKAFQTIRDEQTSRGLMRAQQARSTADWMYMFMTRGYTALGRAGGLGKHLGQGSGRASVVSVGRVQSPTLRLIVERDATIDAFVPVTHYRPQLVVSQDDNEVTLEYAPVITDAILEGDWDDVTWQARDKGADKPLFTKHASVQAFADRLSALGHCDLKAATKPGSKPAPMCFALIDLQRSANSAFKMSAADTLAAAQKLYTDGFISYPRTEHRELPKTAYPDAVDTLKNLAGYGLLPAGDAVKIHSAADAKMPRAYKSKEMEHHGLMPTQKSAKSLNGNLARVYELIAKRYIEAHLPDAITEIMAIQTLPATDGMFSENPVRFGMKGERIVSPGWMAAFRDMSKVEGAELPAIESGPATITEAPVADGQTKPPAVFTENSLLGAMKNAARFLEGDEAKILRGANGLGTPATRASIIETLITREYIRRDKGGKLRANPKGVDLIKNTPSELSDIAMTAQWEGVLAEIEAMPDAQAVPERDQFIAEQGARLTQLLEAICHDLDKCDPADRPRSSGGGSNGPTPKMLALANKISTSLSVEQSEDVATSFDACREFIDANIEDYKANAPSSNGPTPKMLSLAKKLAESAGEKLPSGAISSFDECRAYIDAKMAQPRPPSDKMVWFANKLSTEKSVPLPELCKTDYATCKSFIDQHVG